MLTKYFNEAIRIHNGEIIQRRFFDKTPRGSVSVGPGADDALKDNNSKSVGSLKTQSP